MSTLSCPSWDADLARVRVSVATDKTIAYSETGNCVK